MTWQGISLSTRNHALRLEQLYFYCKQWMHLLAASAECIQIWVQQQQSEMALVYKRITSDIPVCCYHIQRPWWIFFTFSSCLYLYSYLLKGLWLATQQLRLGVHPSVRPRHCATWVRSLRCAKISRVQSLSSRRSNKTKTQTHINHLNCWWWLRPIEKDIQRLTKTWLDSIRVSCSNGAFYFKCLFSACGRGWAQHAALTDRLFDISARPRVGQPGVSNGQT